MLDRLFSAGEHRHRNAFRMSHRALATGRTQAWSLTRMTGIDFSRNGRACHQQIPDTFDLLNGRVLVVDAAGAFALLGNQIILGRM